MISLVSHMNEGTLSIREVANLVYDLKIINLKSSKLYDIIIDYFMKQGFNEKDLMSLGERMSVNFLHSVFYCHPNLKNEGFFGLTRRFIVMQMNSFNKF